MVKELNKKGQGLPLNTIIIAIIVIVALVVIILIFTGNLVNFNKGANACLQSGGVCMPTGCKTGQEPVTTDAAREACGAGASTTGACCRGIPTG